MIFHNYFQGLFILAFLDHLNIPLNILSGRAGHTAGRGVCFLNGKGPWNGLGVFFVSRLLNRQAFVVFVGKLYGTDLDTFPATRTL